MLVEIANQTRQQINVNTIKQAVETVLKFKKKNSLVSVAIVNDQTMARINYAFRGQKKPTDVLSFAEFDSPMADKDFLGEIIIDYEQIKRQAKLLQHSVKYELAFIVIHGTLHLLGYDDKTLKEAKKMEELGYKLFTKL